MGTTKTKDYTHDENKSRLNSENTHHNSEYFKLPSPIKIPKG